MRSESSTATLEAGLREHVPGFRVIEHDLELDHAPGIALPPSASDDANARRADLAGVDPRGRLVLVHFVDGEDDETVLTALDSLAWSNEARASIAMHWRAQGVRDEHEPLVVLVALEFGARCLRALAVLRAENLRLFEMRSVRASISSSAYLVPRDLTVGAREPSPRTVEDLASSVSEPLRPLFDRIVACLEKLDDSISARVHDDTIVWRADAQTLCTLRAARGRLMCSLGVARDEIAVETEAAVDVFLDGVVRAHRNVTPIARSGSALTPRVPLLSPEEIAAFRD